MLHVIEPTPMVIARRRKVVGRTAWRWLHYPIGVGASAGAAWLLIRGIDFTAAAKTLAQASPLFALPIMGILLLRYWLRAVRWRALVLPLRRVSLRHSFDRAVLASVADRILPFNLGYAAIVQIAAARFHLHRSELFGTELLELTLDGLLYALFLVLALVTLPIGPAFGGLALVMLLGTLTALALACWGTRRTPSQTAPSDWPVAAALRRFLDGLRSIQDRRTMRLVFACTVAIWCTEATLYWTVGLALGIHASPLVYTFLVAAANLGASVPLVYSAVGFVYLAELALAAVGQPAEASAALALALEVVLTAPGVLLGPLAGFDLRLRPADLFVFRSRM